LVVKAYARHCAVNCRVVWFWLTLREAEAAAVMGRSSGQLGVVLSGLWLVSAVAGFCFRICRWW
jgi:hypothetical protein